MLFANSTGIIIFAGFKLNQEYIASVLCENRDKPALQCKGKCYMTKKIKQAEEKEKSQGNDIQKSRFPDVFIEEQASLDFPLELIGVLNPAIFIAALPRHASFLFHPPPHRDHQL